MRVPPVSDPVLVAGTDGAGTKVLLAKRDGRLRHDRHRRRGDERQRRLGLRRRRRCSFSTTWSSARSSRRRWPTSWPASTRAACAPDAPCWAARPPSTPGTSPTTTPSTWPVLPSASPAARPLGPQPGAPGDALRRHRLQRPALQRLLARAGAAGRAPARPRRDRSRPAPAWRPARPPATPPRTVGEVLLTPTTIYSRVLHELGHACPVHAAAHITGRRLPRQRRPHPARRHGGHARPERLAAAGRLFVPARSRRGRRRDARHLQLRSRHGPGGAGRRASPGRSPRSPGPTCRRWSWARSSASSRAPAWCATRASSPCEVVRPHRLRGAQSRSHLPPAGRLAAVARAAAARRRAGHHSRAARRRRRGAGRHRADAQRRRPGGQHLLRPRPPGLQLRHAGPHRRRRRRPLPRRPSSPRATPATSPATASRAACTCCSNEAGERRNLVWPAANDELLDGRPAAAPAGGALRLLLVVCGRASAGNPARPARAAARRRRDRLRPRRDLRPPRREVLHPLPQARLVRVRHRERARDPLRAAGRQGAELSARRRRRDSWSARWATAARRSVGRRLDLYVPPHPAEVVDVTGAGDLFAAGFMGGLLEGLGLEVGRHAWRPGRPRAASAAWGAAPTPTRPPFASASPKSVARSSLSGARR